MMKARALLLVLVLATAPLCVAKPAMAPAAKPPPPPEKSPWIWDGEYRLRLSFVDVDQNPKLLSKDFDQSVDHRLRLGLTNQIKPGILLRGRLTTNASRFGDFDTTTFQFTPRRIVFDQLYTLYTKIPKLILFAGRGDNRYFEADLAVATGRFNEDDSQFEGFTATWLPDQQTTVILTYGLVVTTNRLDANPVEFRFDGTLVQLRRQFTKEHRLLVHLAALHPKDRNPLTLGDEEIPLVLLRYDFTPGPDFTLFLQASQITAAVDGVTFLPLTGADRDADRDAFFGGLIFGNKEIVGRNQWELYYARTGLKAGAITGEFPSNIHEIRGIWERQVWPRIWLRVSGIHRELNDPQPPLLKNDQTTGFGQVLMRF